MSTPRMRWPISAEAERVEAMECAEESARMLDDANELLRVALDFIAAHTPGCEAKIARAMAFQSQALALQERIQRLMVQAHAGRRSP